RARAEGSAPEALAAHDAGEKRAVGRQPRAEPDATIRVARSPAGADAPALAPRAYDAGPGWAAGPADRDGRIAEHDARVPEQGGAGVHDEAAGAGAGRGAPAEHEEDEGGEDTRRRVSPGPSPLQPSAPFGPNLRRNSRRVCAP